MYYQQDKPVQTQVKKARRTNPVQNKIVGSAQIVQLIKRNHQFLERNYQTIEGNHQFLEKNNQEIKRNNQEIEKQIEILIEQKKARIKELTHEY